MILTNPRPNRLDEEKDKDYHVRYARWAIGSYNLAAYQSFIVRYLTNIAFYRGNQWIFDEDLDPFLMDESGEVRNRIKWIQNIIKPFVEYYRGAAIRMDLNTEVISMSRESKNRRDMALDRVLYWQRNAKRMMDEGMPDAANQIKQQFGLKDSEQQTIDTFNNLYVDELTMKISKLLKYISTVRNDVAKYKRKLAIDIALSGIGVLKEVDFNGEQVWERTAPERYIFDNTCEEDDFTDSEFMGEFRMASSSDLYEMYPKLTYEEKRMIETSMTNGSMGIGMHTLMSFYLNYAQKTPVYEMYWRDVETSRYGAFYDQFGYPVLEEVSKENPLNELIPVSELARFEEGYDWIKQTLNKGNDKITSNNRVIETEQIRFCSFLPMEYSNAGQDVVLDYGIRRYCQKNRMGYRKPDYPYKAATYSYILGEVMSPVEALISPQRFLNRTLSVAESHINNSRGSGTVIDKDSIDMQGGEEEIQRNMNMSKPVYVRAQRQVNNVIGSYDATIKGGTLSLFDIADRMKGIANDVFGGGESMTGGGGAYRATGAVNQNNIAQGVIMQEPFFNAIERIYMQSFDSMVNRGKRIYLSNRRELSFIAGDDGVVVLEMSKDMLLEDWNAKVVRSADMYTERDAADQMLMIFRDKGMIDDKTYSALFRNSTMMDVAFGLRAFTGLKVEAEKAQAASMERQAAVENEQALMAGEIQNADENKRLAVDEQKSANANNAKIIAAAIGASAKEKQKTGEEN